MKTLIIAALFYTLAAHASDIEVYRFGTTIVAMKQVEGFLVNKSCDVPSCQALKKGKEFGDADLEEEWMVGGLNPFSVRCTKLMGGDVVVGADNKGNQQSFCLFKDDSYLR